MIGKVSNTQTIPRPSVATDTFFKKRSQNGHYFFVTMSFLFLTIALLGFVPSYQDMYSGAFPIHWSAHIHGALMTGWLLIFITQTLLAARGNLKFHRKLGQFSAFYGVIIWTSMAVASARALVGSKPDVDHFLFDVLIFELYAMTLFGIFFTWGVAVRKKGEEHKRLIFFSILVLLQAAIDRMHWLPGLNSALFTRFIYTNMFLIALFIYDFYLLKHIHKITLIGSLIFVVAQFTATMIWGSQVWHRFWFDVITKFT